MLASPAKISLLPEHLIDQIKAGEVIERPGSLIKEIVENSIDAGSSKIELTIINNGLDLISLKDNGRGILSSELALAFSRHATSKISRFEDLYQLASFGFRGEALASIAAISKIQCISFNEVQDEGREIKIEGGLTIYENSRQKREGQTGLELNIQELFFNTPVRLKFIQSHQSEKNYIKKIIYSFIMSHPQIEFIIKINEDEKNIYPVRDSIKERISDVIPKAYNSLITSKRSYEQNEVELFLIPSTFRAPLKVQYSFINKRFVVDKQLLRVIGQAMTTQFGHDDYHYLIFLNLPTDHIDVNVHPNKTIIKMFENSKVISLLSATMKDIATRQSPSQSIEEVNQPSPQISDQDYLLNIDPPLLQQDRHQYNMDGIFSPHQNSQKSENDFLWLNNFFILKKGLTWFAVSPGKLLDYYLSLKLKTTSFSSIPLLVSEPFKFFENDLSRIQSLMKSGVELEKLSPDTMVLRSIPEWLNAIPLRFVVENLIRGNHFTGLFFDSRDWPQETWIRIFDSTDITKLVDEKVILNLESLFLEKLR